MKRPLLILTSVFTLTAARADLIIEQKVESTGQNGTMTLQLKGDRLRMDMPTSPLGAMTTITDLATGDSMALMHGQKMAMKISGAQTKQMLELLKQQATGGGAAGAGKPTATGKTEKIGDFNAEIYTLTDASGTYSFWIAKDFPNFAKIKPQLDQVNQIIGKGIGPDFAALPGIAVKTQMEQAGQKIVMTMVSVKEQPVDAAVFEVPKDYQEIAQPGLPAAPAPAPTPGKPAPKAAPDAAK